MLRLVPGQALPAEPSERGSTGGRAIRQRSPEVVTYHVYSPAPRLGSPAGLPPHGDQLEHWQGLREPRASTRSRRPLEPARALASATPSRSAGIRRRPDDTGAARSRAEAAHGAAWEVLNLGVPRTAGSDSRSSWASATASPLRRRRAVLLREDLHRNTAEAFGDYAKPYFVLARGRLALRNVPVPSPARCSSTPRVPARYLASFARNMYVNFRLAFSLGDLARTRTGEVAAASSTSCRARSRAAGRPLVLADIPSRSCLGRAIRSDAGRTGRVARARRF